MGWCPWKDPLGQVQMEKSVQGTGQEQCSLNADSDWGWGPRGCCKVGFIHTVPSTSWMFVFTQERFETARVFRTVTWIRFLKTCSIYLVPRRVFRSQCGNWWEGCWGSAVSWWVSQHMGWGGSVHLSSEWQSRAEIGVARIPGLLALWAPGSPSLAAQKEAEGGLCGVLIYGPCRSRATEGPSTSWSTTSG